MSRTLHTLAVIVLTMAVVSSTCVVGAARAADDRLQRRQQEAQIELAQAQRDQAKQTVTSARAADRPWRVLLPIGVTLLGALLTAGVGYVAIVAPLRGQREKDRQQRTEAVAAEEKHRRKELVQRFDVGFAGAVAALGEDAPAAQAGGAAALRSFLRPDLTEFRDQTYQVVRAHLDRRIEHPDAVRAILVATLGHMLQEAHGTPTPTSTPRTASAGPPGGPDLTWAWLQRADLRHIDLAAADFWRADLRAARLDRSSLRRARAWKAMFDRASFRGADLEEARFRAVRAASAVFDEARLVSARFEEADLDDARFRGAELQSAHFVDAKLRGADFRDADVRDALFHRAQFDDAALSSLLLARSLWQTDPATGVERLTAHLDDDAAQRLRQLAARRRRQRASA